MAKQKNKREEAVVENDFVNDTNMDMASDVVHNKVMEEIIPVEEHKFVSSIDYTFPVGDNLVEDVNAQEGKVWKQEVLNDVVEPEKIVAKPEGKEDLLAELKKKFEVATEPILEEVRKPFVIDVEVNPTVKEVKTVVDRGVSGSRNHIFTIDRDKNKNVAKKAVGTINRGRVSGNRVKDSGARSNMGAARGAHKIFEDKPVKN